MSTVEPRRVWPHLSCSWEVIGTYSSTGTQRVLCAVLILLLTRE